MRGGALEPEARVVLRMAEHDYERTAALAEDLESSPHELGAKALALAVQGNGQGRQPHPDDSARVALDHRRGEEDVTHAGFVLGHQ